MSLPTSSVEDRNAQEFEWTCGLDPDIEHVTPIGSGGSAGVHKVHAFHAL